MRPPRAVAGITFTVDTTPDRGSSSDAPAAARLFTRVTAAVTATADRGRVDILAVLPTRASVAGLPVTEPAARPGDYYLFDSTGVVLVRPHVRRYARLPFGDYGVGGPEDRTGWPSTIFRVTPVRVVALPAGARRADTRAWARDLVVYWHLDVDQEASTYHVLARGRLRAARLPLGEVGVDVGGDGHLGGQVTEVPHPALLGGEPGGEHDRLHQALGVGPGAAGDPEEAVGERVVLLQRLRVSTEVGPRVLRLPAGQQLRAEQDADRQRPGEQR